MTDSRTARAAYRTCRRCVDIAVLCLVMLASRTCADEALSSKLLPVSGTGEHDVVLRVTKQHFDDLTRDEFQQAVPIQRPLLSAWISGMSQVQGRVQVEMESDDDEAVFVVTLDGEAHSTTVSSARSIRVHGGGTSNFHVEKRIRFDGVAYHGQPTSVSLSNDAYVRRICSTRRCIGGRLAVGIARRRVAQQRSEASRIIERDSRTRIRDEFDQLANELIEKLNQTTPIEETIMQLFPETENWVYDLSTTDEYIQVSAGPKGFRFPELTKQGKSRQRDPVELWIRASRAKDTTEVMEMWNVAQELLRTMVSEDADLPAPLRGQARAEQVEDWIVIAIGQTSSQ